LTDRRATGAPNLERAPKGDNMATESAELAESTEPAPIPADILSRLQEPCGQSLEHRKRIKSPTVLATLIAAFAHSEECGTIIVGFDAQKGEIYGVKNRSRLEQILDEAVSLLGRTSLVPKKINFYKSDEGKIIGVIMVPSVDILVVSPGGKALVRVGARIELMSKDAIVVRATKKRMRMEDLGGVFVRQSNEIAKLRSAAERHAEELAAAKKGIDATDKRTADEYSSVGKARNHIIGYVLTLITGVALPYLYQFLASFLR